MQPRTMLPLTQTWPQVELKGPCGHADTTWKVRQQTPEIHLRLAVCVIHCILVTNPWFINKVTGNCRGVSDTDWTSKHIPQPHNMSATPLICITWILNARDASCSLWWTAFSRVAFMLLSVLILVSLPLPWCSYLKAYALLSNGCR